MKCLECNKKMDKGYIPLGKGLNWREFNKGYFACNPLGNAEGVKIGDEMSVKKLIAYRCNDCEIITFRCGSKAELKE